MNTQHRRGLIFRISTVASMLLLSSPFFIGAAVAKKAVCYKSANWCVIYDDGFCSRTARQVRAFKRSKPYIVAITRAKEKGEDPMTSTTYRNVISGEMAMKAAGCK
jgi:hypothetical protein